MEQSSNRNSFVEISGRNMDRFLRIVSVQDKSFVSIEFSDETVNMAESQSINLN